MDVLKANMAPVHNAASKAANGVAGKVDSVVGMGDGSRPVIDAPTGAVKGAACAPTGAVKGVPGAPTGAVKGAACAPTGAVKGVPGAPTGAVKGAAGVKSDKAIRGTANKAAEIDPLRW
ncbi:hypothetical protein OIU78_025010 [Salix suchowensis]|nr:hypothetical protein OIU78_025010 [Salix suchowensis]